MDRREALQRTALLMGTALTPGLITAVLQGCTPKVELGWSPLFLSGDEAFLVRQVVDRIIPATDTPGALDVGVDQFIDRMLSEVYSEEDGNLFKKGLRALDNESEMQFARSFSQLQPEQMDEILKKFEADENRVFQINKELTLIGYFTSEQGIKSNFEYIPVPGSYDACVNYKQGDKLWRGNHVFKV